MSQGYWNPGLYRARSVARTSDNGDRTERRPASRFCASWERARRRRREYLDRVYTRAKVYWCNALRHEVFAEQIGSYLELGPLWQWSEEGRTRLNVRQNARTLLRIVRSRALGVFDFIDSKSYLLRRPQIVKGAPWLKSLGGRLFYVLAKDLPIVGAIPVVASIGKNLDRGFCPCGQHSTAYYVCENYWELFWRSSVSYVRDYILVYSRTNNDYSPEMWAKIVDLAREYNFKNKRGQELLGRSVVSTLIHSVPYLSLTSKGMGALSDTYYVLTGRSLDVSGYKNAASKRMFDFHVGKHPVDEVFEFFSWKGGGFLKEFYDRLEETQIISDLSPYLLLDRELVVSTFRHIRNQRKVLVRLGELPFLATIAYHEGALVIRKFFRQEISWVEYVAYWKVGKPISGYNTYTF